MIELILTNTLDSFPILEKLKNSLKETKRHLLFVPDRFSLSYQKAVLEHLGIKGSFDIEVTSFVRLADKMLENDKKVLDKQSEVMLLRKVIEENKKQLLCFGRATASVSFAEDMYAAISQIRNSNIPVNRMAESVDGLPTRVANKTKDIVRIYRSYVEYLQNGYTDGTSKLQALTDRISAGELNDCNIYISDFMSFSGVEYECLKAIMLNCMNTRICLVDSEGENKHVFPSNVKKRLLSIIDEIGLSAKITYCREQLEGDAKVINEQLYGYAHDNKSQSTGYTEIYTCKDIADEVKNIARIINNRVKAEGARYKDMAIVCCDFPAYVPYIKSIFSAFGIPFYADVKQPLSQQAVTKLLDASVRCAVNGMECADVTELSKQLLLLLDYDDVCVFENYCLKYGIEYTRFLSPFTIGEENDRKVAEGIRAKLAKLVAPFVDLEGKVSDYTAKIREFFKTVDADNLVNALAQKQSEEGYDELSSLTLQSLQKISILLDRCDAMLGGEEMSFDEFYKIFSTAIDSVEMSNIPLYLDCVFIGESSQSRYENIDYMFVLGANAGKFPLEHVDNGIVAEREYVAWSRMGIDVQPDCRRRNAQERLNVLMLLTRAKKKLYISYPSASVSGAELLPSDTVKYIEELLSIKAIPAIQPQSEWTLEDYARYVSARGNVLEELLDMNKAFVDGRVMPDDVFAQTADVLYSLAVKEYGKESVDKLLSQEEDEKQIDGRGIMFNGNHISSSQIEKYFKCPYLHFTEQVLKLKRREINGLEVKDTGTLLHAVLEKYFALSDCADKSEDEIKSIVPILFAEAVRENPDYAFLLDDEKQTLTVKQLISQAVYVIVNLVKNMQVTKFRPLMLEAKFGDKDNENSLKGMEVNNGYRKLYFKGTIDRVDVYKDRAIVIDYKSKGSIEFDFSNVLYGDRIQLFIYLNALRANSNLTPQGVFYLLMNNKFIKGDKTPSKRFMYRGFVGCDESGLADLDEGFAEGADFVSTVYPIKRKSTKSGITISAQAGGAILTTDEFYGMCDYVTALTEKAAKEIEEGYIAKSPLNIKGDEEVSACSYCDYRNVCDRAGRLVRDVKQVKKEQFKEVTEGRNGANQLD